MTQKFLDLETGLPELWKKTTEKIEDATLTKLESADYLGPVVMEGNPLQFNNGVEGLNIAVTEQVLEPVQAGSGDPSPENIRAISGWTGAKLVRCGKNLINPAADDTGSYSQCMTHKSDGSIVIENTSSANIYPKTVWTAIPAGTYAVHCSCTVENTGCYLQQQSDDYSLDIANDTKIITFTEDTQVRLLFAINGSTANAVYTVQLECGSTVTKFEPYIGDSYTVEFGDAVYGGTLNWTTGVMTVDRKLYTLTGTGQAYAVNLGNSDTVQQINVTINSLGAVSDSGDVCTHFIREIYVTSGGVEGFRTFGGNTVIFGIPKATLLQYGTADNNTSSEWAALANAFFADQYAAGTPVQVAYKLAEPYTIQMTPQEIKQLNGTNTLYGDGTKLRAIFNASTSSPVDTNLSTTSSNPVQNKTVTSSINSLKSVATASSAGLMSATDKSKLDTITTSADSVSFSQSATSGNKVGTITINGTAIDMYSPIQTTISGNAATATKVSNALTIQANGSSLGTFDGSSAKTFNITYSNVGAAAASHGTHVSYGTSASALGTSSAGSASTVSRSDHVHALPALTSCTGTLTIAKGGTGLTSSPSMLINLASTSAANVLQASPRPGVTGTLPIGNGGTGATSAANARSNLGIKSGTTLPTSGSVGDIFFLY